MNGSRPEIWVNDPKLFEEVLPHSDRVALDGTGFARLSGSSEDRLVKTDDYNSLRKQTFLKCLGIMYL